MSNGFPAFRPNHVPNEKTPTPFHPASSKSKPAKDTDAASMMSTFSFASTVSLIKANLKLSDKEKEGKAQVEKKQSLADVANREHLTPRQRTAEAYMIYATTK